MAKTHQVSASGEGTEWERKDEQVLDEMFEGKKPGNSGQPTDADNWFDDFAENQGEQEQGLPLADKLAVLVGKISVNYRLSTVRELQANYAIPSNCKAVMVPKVNGKIKPRPHQRAQKSVKFLDQCLSSVQRSLIGGSGTLIKMV